MAGHVFTTRGFAVALSVLMISALRAAGQTLGVIDHETALARLGRYVEQYYYRAQHVVAEEVVTLQPLRYDMTFDGLPRRLVYELRVEWAPGVDGGATGATVIRQLISVGGRPPRPGYKPECLDLPALSPEPLASLLPSRRERFTFTTAGQGRVARRTAVMFDYRPVAAEKPTITWRDDCVTVDAPGHTRGRVWIDPDSAEVLRLDERVAGVIPIPVPPKLQRLGGRSTMTIERAESSIRYSPVKFTNPDETILLPTQIDSVTVIRDSGVPRLRTTQTFSKYRRFVTDSRIVQ